MSNPLFSLAVVELVDEAIGGGDVDVMSAAGRRDLPEHLFVEVEFLEFEVDAAHLDAELVGHERQIARLGLDGDFIAAGFFRLEGPGVMPWRAGLGGQFDLLGLPPGPRVFAATFAPAAPCPCLSRTTAEMRIGSPGS